MTLRQESNKNIKKYRQIIVSLLIAGGILLFILAYFQFNMWAILIGLGLVILGTTTFFTTSTKMVQANIITSQLISLTLALYRTLKASGQDGETYIVPPKVPGEQPVQIIRSTITNSQTSHTPTGLNLESSFEEASRLNFFAIDLSTLEHALARVIVDNFELASDFKISNQESNQPIIQMNGFAFSDIFSYMPSVEKHATLHLPIVSALACALAKTTHKAVSIRDYMLKQNNITLQFDLFPPAEI